MACAGGLLTWSFGVEVSASLIHVTIYTEETERNRSPSVRPSLGEKKKKKKENRALDRGTKRSGALRVKRCGFSVAKLRSCWFCRAPCLQGTDVGWNQYLMWFN